MIRFYLKRETQDPVFGLRDTVYETVEASLPELEQKLTRGGFSEKGYDRTLIVDAGIIPDKGDINEDNRTRAYYSQALWDKATPNSP